MKGLVLTYLITALASIGALRRPLIGLYVYVGFAVLRPQFIFGWAGDLSNVSFIVGIALLAGWLINGFGTWRPERARGIVLALFAYTGFFTLSALLAGDTAASYKAWLELMKIVLPFCVGFTMMDTEAQWKPLLWIVVLSMGYVGFEQNLNYLTGYNSAAIGFGGMDNNCFGVALVAVLGPAIALVMASRRWYERIAAGTAAALILHATLLTFSRGAMVGLLCVGAAAFIALPKRPVYIGVMLVVALLAVRLTGPQLAARYSTAFVSSDQRDGSAESRVELWMDCLKVIAARPILGVGPANWRLVASTFGWTEGKSAHSVWMESAAEIGVPGTLALFAFFAVAAFRLWPLARARLTDDNRYQTAAAMGVVLSVVGFAASGQFVSVVGLEAPYYIVMIGAAVLKGRSVVPLPVTESAADGTAPARSRTPAPRPTWQPAATTHRLIPHLPTEPRRATAAAGERTRLVPRT